MTSLTLVRHIAARPAVVFDAITTAEGISSWWGPDDGPVLLAETDVRVGGRFRVRFRMLDGSEHESTGSYIEVLPPERLVMSWRWTEGGEADEGEAESRIEIALRPLSGGTELSFTHCNLQTDASRDSHQSGWSGSLDKLVRRFALQAGEAA